MTKKFYNVDIGWKSCEALLIKLIEKKVKSQLSNKNELEFLNEIGFLDDNYKPTKKCINYYHKKYIENKEDEAKNILSSIMKNYRPVKILCEVLWGVNNLTKENIYRFLLINNVINDEVSVKGITGFIMLLNSCNILTYSKKNKRIVIKFNPRSENTSRKERILAPTTPYSNIKSLWELIRSCEGYLWWIDKHFSPKGLEPLSEELDGNKISEVKILLSINSNINFKKLKRDFIRFKEEMKNRGIESSCKIIVDKNLIREIHGRWILSKSICCNIPPINSIFMGQYDEMKITNNRPPFEVWWTKSKDIIDEWAEIPIQDK